ncbi:D-beta-hydroxybutyrate dehydrogenase, mitochondrial [Lycorma delicatula]|uniref:D-beta-hydroxybutyrate dehydrogenase, mitochondrial n=1 Tax=Lycorma delicatula TaxID=130591 RepID=UPI003F5137A9
MDFSDKLDEQTVVVLAVQLLALTCIAGSLLLYLLCKIKSRRHTYDSELTVGTGRSVLVTSCDTAFGLQLVLHLSALGFRVFAGFKPIPENSENNGDRTADSDASKILRAKLKQREVLLSSMVPGVEESGVLRGSIITLPLDVTREDSLHEAVNIIRRHLPAGEDGLWSVINTAGVCLKGRLESQDSCQWDTVLKVNVVGTLRTARAFLPLLRTTKGRFLTIGTGGESSGGAVVYSAARHAVVGASSGLQQELGPMGVHFITLQTDTIPSEKFFARPRVHGQMSDRDSLPNDRYLKFNVEVIPTHSIHIIEEALLTHEPKQLYHLALPNPLSNYITAITDKFSYNQEKKKKNAAAATTITTNATSNTTNAVLT